MNKKILVGLSILGVSVGFWACGDGSVEAKSGDDELALLNYGEFNEGGMAGLVSGAMSECEADPACAAKMEGSTYVPPEQEPESTDSGETTTPGGDSGTPGNTTPGNTTPGNTTPGNTTPGNTTPASSPADVSSSSTAPSTNPTVSSSSVQQQTAVSSSSAQQQTTPSSSSVQQQTQPSSNSQQSSASSGGGNTIKLTAANTPLGAGEYTVESNSCSNPVAMQCNNGCSVSVNGTEVYSGAAYEYNQDNTASAFPVGATVTVTGNGLQTFKCAW